MHCSLLVMCAVIFAMLSTTHVSGGTFTHYSKGKGNNCRDDAMTFNLTLPSQASCAFKCQIRKRCSSFYYNEVTGFCVGCRGSCDKTSNVGRPSKEQCWQEKREDYATDCLDHKAKFNSTEEGVYRIKTYNGNVYDVYCFIVLQEGHFAPEWMIILRRSDGSVEFNRTFKEYRDGFGDINGNHWIGLEFLHEMTKDKRTEVMFEIDERVYITETAIKTGHFFYSDFSVGPAPGYKLSIGENTHDGTVINGLDSKLCFTDSNNSDFSMKDRDLSGSNCSSRRGNGGWWWNHDCLGFNPTGLYMEPVADSRCNANEHVKQIKMAFRRKT